MKLQIPSISAAACLDQARVEWTACKKMLSDGIDINLAVIQLEQWLSRWDPLYTATGAFLSIVEPVDAMADCGGLASTTIDKLSAIELLRLRRQKQSASASQPAKAQPLKLHPNNNLVIEAVLELGNRLFALISRRGTVFLICLVLELICL